MSNHAANPVTPYESSASAEIAEGASAVVDWLLHDDLVIRECFRHAAAIVKTVTGADCAAVMLLDTDLEYYKAEVGFNAPAIPRARAICDHAVSGNDLFVLEDASQDPQFADCVLVGAPFFTRFYAAIPLHGPDGEVVGALCAMGRLPRKLDAGQCAVFVHLRHMIENDLRLRMATAIDPLTQLFSRRFFVESVRKKWAETAPGSAMGFGVIDVDWFKQYNDSFGHPAGDECLRAIARIFLSVSDGERVISGRLGGEEFGIVVSDASHTEMTALGERLRAEIEALQYRHVGSPLGVVTISLGATVAVKDIRSAITFRDLFARADRALYTAKRDGRNRTIVD